MSNLDKDVGKYSSIASIFLIYKSGLDVNFLAEEIELISLRDIKKGFFASDDKCDSFEECGDIRLKVKTNWLKNEDTRKQLITEDFSAIQITFNNGFSAYIQVSQDVEFNMHWSDLNTENECCTFYTHSKGDEKK